MTSKAAKYYRNYRVSAARYEQTLCFLWLMILLTFLYLLQKHRDYFTQTFQVISNSQYTSEHDGFQYLLKMLALPILF